MKAGDDPRTDQSGSKNVPDPPPNSDPVKAPGGVTESNPQGTPPGPGSHPGTHPGGDKR